MIEELKIANMATIGLFFLLMNIAIFGISIVSCWLLGVVFCKKRIFDRWEPMRAVEIVAACSAVILNAGISVFGWHLWTHHVISLNDSNVSIIRSGVDCLVMVLAMDLGMYVFHRVAHISVMYQWIHRFHHRHEATNPISLFVLHPLEVIGFGLLMILFLIIYQMSIGGLISYLTLNVIFGTIGHSGVEPFPAFFKRIPVLRLIGTSTFHAEHHEQPRYNFGFYTLVWDKIFGTLDPDYDQRFSRKQQ